MTEGAILFGIFLSSITLIDPFFGGGLAGSQLAKAQVIIMVFGPMLLHFPGRMLADMRGWQRSSRSVFRDWWPVIALASLITLGSLTARYLKGIDDSFLNFGLGMFFLPLFALFTDTSAKKDFLLKGYAAIYVITVVLMYPILAFRLHVLHEQIFIAVPLGLYFLSARKPTFWGIAFGLSLILFTTIAFKNTTFLLIVASIGVWVLIMLARVARSRDQLSALTYIYIGAVGFLAFSSLVAAVWWTQRDLLPGGNTIYRLEMYHIAYQKFLASPLWGSWFSNASVSYFRLYEVAVGTNYLPTHSDVLDILANGGLLAIGLWVATIYRIIRMTLSSFMALTGPGFLENERRWRWLLVMGMVQIGAVITYAVNPPLTRLVNGLWIWGGAGIMWALHRSIVLANEPGNVPLKSPENQRPFNRYTARYL